MTDYVDDKSRDYETMASTEAAVTITVVASSSNLQKWITMLLSIRKSCLLLNFLKWALVKALVVRRLRIKSLVCLLLHFLLNSWRSSSAISDIETCLRASPRILENSMKIWLISLLYYVWVWWSFCKVSFKLNRFENEGVGLLGWKGVQGFSAPACISLK